MKNKKEMCPLKRKSPIQRLSALLIFVALVFMVLLISYTVAGVTLFLLVRNGLVSPVGNRNFAGILVFLLLVSLGIGTIFSTLGGTWFLRPVRRLNDATKEIAAGNFGVRVEASGPYEMQRLAGSFNEMASELGSIETLRNDFVSNVSHEFKTPVASIRGFARLLKRNNLTDEQREEYLDIILLEAERLSQLSGNVLLLSKLDSSDQLPENEEFPLDEQLRQCVLLLEPQFEKKQLDVKIDLQAISYTGSEELLRHVWLNLLNNAIKFTPQGGQVCISATQHNDAAVVTIADTGPGMSEEVQRHLFEKFYQGDASRATQGNGLGLSLVKRILDLSSGEIKVESKEGQGACFTVLLPQKNLKE